MFRRTISRHIKSPFRIIINGMHSIIYTALLFGTENIFKACFKDKNSDSRALDYERNRKSIISLK